MEGATHQRLFEVAILATPETTTSTVYGMNDLLCSAGRDWSFVTEGVLGDSVIKPIIIARSTDFIATVNHGYIKPHRTLSEDYMPDAVCLLELFLDPYADISNRYAVELDWLKKYWEKGGIIGAACTGAMLLAEAGLLDGFEATTHWGFCDAMSNRYPNVKVRPRRTLIATGPEQRLILSGGGSSWMDLGLYLVSRFVGIEEAIKVAKLHLIEIHEEGQMPHSYIGSTKKSDDAIISESQVWLAQNYDQSSPINAVIKNSGLSERSFIRRFKKETGLTPIEYVLNLRIEEAKLLLETNSEPIDAIAEMVGYQDASFFSRNFKKNVGITPSQYRKKFSKLRNYLS